MSQNNRFKGLAPNSEPKPIHENELNEKRLNGVFYTITNPFKLDIFYKWLDLIPTEDKELILEPFAGANNIVAMIHELGVESKWECYDINPPTYNNFLDYPVHQRDTLLDYPKGFGVAITNPPYLAKNSATRRGLPFPPCKYDDLYKHCLDVMLTQTPYVAAIIPESFLTQELFQNRLFAIVSLTCKMFDDTECPVCLALFIPEHSNDFVIYRQNRLIGNYSELKRCIKTSSFTQIKWKFNDKTGSVGLYAIDNQLEPSIHFCIGDEINPEDVKSTSRSITRISGLPDNIDLEKFIDKCNELLLTYRTTTKDVFLTSFKGLRKDNQYRRRIDFKTAKNILNQAMECFLAE